MAELRQELDRRLPELRELADNIRARARTLTELCGTQSPLAMGFFHDADHLETLAGVIRASQYPIGAS